MQLTTVEGGQCVAGEQPIVPRSRRGIVARHICIKHVGEVRHHQMLQALPCGQLVAGTGQVCSQVSGGDRHLRIGVGDVMLQLFRAVHRVDWHHHRIGAQNAEMRHHQLRAVLHVEHHTIAFLHTHALQKSSNFFCPR